MSTMCAFSPLAPRVHLLPPDVSVASDSFAQRQHTCGHSSGFESCESCSVVLSVIPVGSRAVNLTLWSFRHTGRATLWENIFAYFSTFLGTFKKRSQLRETLKKKVFAFT